MKPIKPMKSRGALSNPECRYQATQSEQLDDGWFPEAPADRIATQVIADHSKTVISRNQSPDVPFEQSLNPYRGCEHGCIYCFARPSHAWLGWSPGMDFETKILAKHDAAECLRRELSARNYQCRPLAMGTNTDPYQPVEQRLRITRQVLEVCAEFNQPVTFVTKSALIERDLDILQPMAEKNLLEVMISVTSLDRQLSHVMEPRAAVPERRLKTIRVLSEAGIPTGVLFAPVIPFLNDGELEQVLAASAGAGARNAAYVLLRLPLEVAELFQQWLQQHYPMKAERIMQRMRDCRQGRVYAAGFGQRMTGSGEFAELIGKRFSLAEKKQQLDRLPVVLDCSQFRVPLNSGADSHGQMSLFE